MARSLRIEGPGLTYHVTSRGTGRMTVFRDDVDRRRFLALLAALTREHHLACHAYCLMSNHYHLVVTTVRGGLARTMRQLNGVYAQRWNARHEHVGHLFQGRYVAQLVQDGPYFLTVCRYVALNPVRARIVASPERWPWSSFRATAGLSRPPRFLDRTMLLGHFSEQPNEAERAYRSFVASEALAPAPLPPQRILGDETFVRTYAQGAALASAEVPRAERLESRPLATFFRGAVTRNERDVAILAAHEAGYTHQVIASHLELHYSTISRIVAARGGGVRS